MNLILRDLLKESRFTYLVLFLVCVVCTFLLNVRSTTLNTEDPMAVQNFVMYRLMLDQIVSVVFFVLVYGSLKKQASKFGAIRFGTSFSLMLKWSLWVFMVFAALLLVLLSVASTAVNGDLSALIQNGENTSDGYVISVLIWAILGAFWFWSSMVLASSIAHVLLVEKKHLYEYKTKQLTLLQRLFGCIPDWKSASMILSLYVLTVWLVLKVLKSETQNVWAAAAIESISLFSIFIVFKLHSKILLDSRIGAEK